ncbi:MAG: leucine-rich repeat domain-containing protein, partial [FCB group bacterium]|nr:leucine-rich repeat domain-containing protein [FCB group bacterium]
MSHHRHQSSSPSYMLIAFGVLVVGILSATGQLLPPRAAESSGITDNRDFDAGDLQVLQDIITLNDLDIAPLDLGTQIWIDDRLVALQAGWETNYDLTILPESIDSLTQLVELDLYGNNMSSLPEAFGGLNNLQFLDLGANSLASLPSSFTDLTALRNLDLSDNDLAVLPVGFGNFAALYQFNVQGNQLTE